MTTFQNGPAAGRSLPLRRSPRFLRVTEKGGKWDALDQLEDTPRPGETLHAYAIAGEPGRIHVQNNAGSGWYAVATYRHVPCQPSQEVMQDAPEWRKWCLAEQERRAEPLPCPWCEIIPSVFPLNPATDGSCWAEVSCINPECPAQPKVRDGQVVNDPSIDYKGHAIARWNRRPRP